MSSVIKNAFNTIAELPYSLPVAMLLSGLGTVSLVLHLDSTIQLLPQIF